MKQWKRWNTSLLCLLLLCTLLPQVSAQLPQEVEDGQQQIQKTLDEQGQIQIASDEQQNQTATAEEEFDENFRSRVIMGDPGFISDEDFFGKWDNASGTWIKKPYFDYDYAPEMAYVEGAVKDGDYEGAKALLFNYYCEKEERLQRTPLGSVNKSQYLTAQLLCDNLMYNGNSGISLVDVLTVDNEAKYVHTDVSSFVSKAVEDSTFVVPFLVMATKKDGCNAVFNSKEAGENIPYVEVVANGVRKKYYPTDDTMVRTENYAGQNYGSEPQLLAMESGIGRNNPATVGGNSYPFDDNTKRIYLKFKFDDLRKGDKIEAATLNLYGQNLEQQGEKDVVVFTNNETAWKENEYTWNSINHLIFSWDREIDFVWTQPKGAGYRFEEEMFRFNTWFDVMVGQYNVTGDEELAFHAIRHLMNYINMRGSNPSHKKTLDVALRMTGLPGWVAQLYKSVHMTPERFTAILKFMWRMGNAAKSYTTSGNWGTAESEGLYMLCLTYPEFVDAPAWQEVVVSRVNKLSSGLLRDDGSCSELSLGYTLYAIGSMLGIKSKANTYGVEPAYHPDVINRILKLTQYVMYSSGPNWGDNQQGDAYSYKSDFRGDFENVGRWLNDPHLLYAATDGKEGEVPDFTSHIYNTTKKVIMRTGWGIKDSYMQLNADGAVGSHGHHDDLGLIAYAYGKYLLVDPLYYSYDNDSPYRKWLISNKGHNTIVVNGKNQTQGTRGSIDRFETNDSYDYVSISTPNNPDAKHTRNVLFLKPGIWIVSDYLQPKDQKAQTNYSPSWHFLPDANITIDEESKIVRTNFDDVNIQVVPADPSLYSYNSIEDGYFSQGNNSLIEAKYARSEFNAQGNVSIDHILYAENDGEQFEIATNPIPVDDLEGDGSAFECFVNDTNLGHQYQYTYFGLNNKAKKKERTTGAYASDGTRLMVQERNGTVEQIVLQDATHVKNEKENYELVYSKQPIDELSVEWNISDIQLSTSKELDREQIAVYMPEQKKLFWNGEEVAYQYQDGYAFFGEPFEMPVKPPVNPTPEPTIAPTASAPVHNSGGGIISGGNAGGGGIPEVISTPTPTAQIVPTPTPDITPAPPISSGVLTETMKAELSGHWAEEEISHMVEQGIVQGEQNGTLALEQEVTRSEFAALLVRALRLDMRDYQNGYADVSPDAWYASVMQAALDYGILEGYGGNLMPEEMVTREQMAKMLVKAYELKTGVEPPKQEIPFTDKEQISNWAVEFIQCAYALGIIKGEPDGRCEPRAWLQRDDAIVAIYRLMDKIGDI